MSNINILIVKRRAEEYFKKYKNNPNLVTLAGFTRALDFQEGDIEKLLDDSGGRRILLRVYLELAEIIEKEANKKPSQHRSEMLKGLNKFVGGLYSYDKTSTVQYINAKTSFAEIGQRSQQKLMKAIANRANVNGTNANKDDSIK